MTTPRDAAVEMVSEMIYRRVVTPILGGSDWEHEPKSENRVQCDELASRIVAALASSPAQGTTLAELVDAYDEAKANQTIAYNNWRNGQGQTIFADNLERTQAVAKEKRQALLAYQPPAPVSRAGAVEVTDAMLEAGYKAYNEACNDSSIRPMTHVIRSVLAASPPAVAVRAVTEISDAMVEAALNEKYDDGATVDMGGKRHIPLSQMSFSETSRMRRMLAAALAAAEGRA